MEKKTISQIKSVLSVLNSKDTLVINKYDDRYIIFTLDSKLSIEYTDLYSRHTGDKNGFYTILVKEFKKVVSDDFFCNLTAYAKFCENDYGYENILDAVYNNSLGYNERILSVNYKDIHKCYALFSDSPIGQYMYVIDGVLYATNGHFIIKNKTDLDVDVTLYKDICTIIEKLKENVLIQFGKVIKDDTRSGGANYNVVHMSLDVGEVMIRYTDASLTLDKETDYKNMLKNYKIEYKNGIKVNRKDLLTAVKNLKVVHPLGHAKLVVKDRCLSLFDLKVSNTLGRVMTELNEQKVISLNTCDGEFYGYFHIEYLEKIIKNIENDTLYINEKILGDYAMSFTLHDNDFTAYLMGVRM